MLTTLLIRLKVPRTTPKKKCRKNDILLMHPMVVSCYLVLLDLTSVPCTWIFNIMLIFALLDQESWLIRTGKLTQNVAANRYQAYNFGF